jgi:hypothetical protein
MRSVPKRSVLAASLVCALLVLTGCSQSQIYAADKASGVYVAVPNGWHKISNTELNKAEAKSTAPGAADRLANVVWQEAYSTSSKTNAVGTLNLEAPDGAIAYVRVRDLNYDDMNSISYNALRDLILPISTWLSDPTKTNSKFVLHDDHERVEKIARGVRTVYTFGDQNGVRETIDQTAMVSDDRSRIYVLIVRATTQYFKKHVKELQAIGDSVTVRGNK